MRARRRSISAFLPNNELVERALIELANLGVPRDLIEVVVSPVVAAREYKRRPQALGRQSFRFAGAGAVTGLLVGAALSLLLILNPGRDLSSALSLVQLLGPNFGLLFGAVVGAVIGWFAKRHPKGDALRAIERDQILVLVRERVDEEVEPLRAMFDRLGAVDLLVT